ncbi:hypothetical protein [Dactylosporangium salmoneum]|uniref:Uncharacterized protein n=1 Tax=Dactylosporangium salmoneum TaxID=53361 RepID=A0ABN3I6C2_9ACTN
MTTDLEARLTESMHHRVDGLVLTDDVLARATTRHRRRTNLIRAGAVAVAIAVAVGGIGAVGPHGKPRPQQAQQQAQPPKLRLAAAARASEDISYRIKLQAGTRTCEGAFDPRTNTGYVRCPQDDSVMTELLVNGTRYVGGEPPLTPLPPDKTDGEQYGRYGRESGTYDRLSLYAPNGSVLGAVSPDPAALFDALQREGAAVTANPDGTLHFQYSLSETSGSSDVAGDVTLDADGRIAKVAMSIHWQSTAKGRLDQGTYPVVLELSGYGEPVTVAVPTDVFPAR